LDLDADQPVADLPISRTRLTEILAGQRTDDHVSKEEKQRRQNEAKILLQKVFGVSSLTEGLLCLYNDPAKFVVEILRIDELRKLLTEQLKDALFPTPVDLLKLKDFLLISDAKWKAMEGYFNLPTSHRLWKLRELRKNLNDEAGVSYTTSGHGSTIGITKLIGDMIRKDPPSDASQPITLKFAFDACRITSNVEEVIGTISKVRMDRQSKSQRVQARTRGCS
jgi:hypothetical protein